MKKNNTPEVRFAGFSGEWEETRLSDIVKLFGGNAFSSSDASSFGVPWLKIANVGINGIDWSTSSYLPDELWNSYKDYRLYKGDYVMALTRPILNHILKISIVDKKALLNQRVAKLIFATNAEYGYQLLQRRSVVDKIENELAGTDPPNLGSGNLKNIDISIPLNKDEQLKIGNFFKQLDDTIALHQQELNTLKQTKQGFLQKMFPKEGQSVPEVRFPVFTGEWELLKLNEVAEIIGGGTPSTNVQEYWDGDIDWYSPVEIGKKTYASGSRRKITALGLKKSSAKVLPADRTILFTSRAGIGDMAILKKDGATNQGFQSLVINNNFDTYFVYSIGYKIKEFALKHASGSTFLEISRKNLGEMHLFVPSLEEQSQIGNFFKQLDDTIALHQRELDALKETKKAFLQKMFV